MTDLVAHLTPVRQWNGTRDQLVCDKLTSMNDEQQNPSPSDDPVNDRVREIHEVPAVELINTAAVHLMTATAVKVGLADMPNAEELIDLNRQSVEDQASSADLATAWLAEQGLA